MEYCSHSTEKDVENNQEGNDEIPSNTLEALTKILSITQGKIAICKRISSFPCSKFTRS